MNLIQLIDFLKPDDESSGEKKLFYCCKRILIWGNNITGFLENLFEYCFLYTIVNVNFFSDLKFEYYFEYYPEILLQESLK